MLIDQPQAFALARRQKSDRIFGRDRTRSHGGAS
jgi:hypothetical protein